jgi:ADP-ribosylglycohydrolase
MCIGALVGDIVGSRFEGRRSFAKPNFILFAKESCFTDDTVLTIATMDAVLNTKTYLDVYSSYYRKYPYAGYGSSFKRWATSKDKNPYNSWGNGSAMRVSPLAYCFDTKEEVLEEAKRSAEITHSHPEGIKGAQAVALAIFMARNSCTKDDIRKAMTEEMGYELDDEKIAKGFRVSCQESVPQALKAFLDSEDLIDAIRRAVHMRGDSDTLACIAGSIAQPFYTKTNFIDSIPESAIIKIFERLPQDMAQIVVEFTKKYVYVDFKRPAIMSDEAQLYDLFRSIFS